MGDESLVYSVEPQAGIRLKHWKESAILYHGMSATTIQISPIMAIAIDKLLISAANIEQIVKHTIAQCPDLNPDECRDHIKEGISMMLHEGLILAREG